MNLLYLTVVAPRQMLPLCFLMRLNRLVLSKKSILAKSSSLRNLALFMCVNRVSISDVKHIPAKGIRLRSVVAVSIEDLYVKITCLDILLCSKSIQIYSRFNNTCAYRISKLFKISSQIFQKFKHFKKQSKLQSSFRSLLPHNCHFPSIYSLAFLILTMN